MSYFQAVLVGFWVLVAVANLVALQRVQGASGILQFRVLCPPGYDFLIPLLFALEEGIDWVFTHIQSRIRCLLDEESVDLCN